MLSWQGGLQWLLTDPNFNAPTVPSPGVHRPLAEADLEMAVATAAELRDQQPTLEMIASCARVDVRRSAAPAITTTPAAEGPAALTSHEALDERCSGCHYCPAMRNNIETEWR